MLYQALQELGLSEKESVIYLTLLKIGPASAFTISKKTDIHHATVYTIVESLIKKRLVSKRQKKTTTIFIPNEPHNLHQVIDDKRLEISQQETKLDEILPELATIFLSSQTDLQVRLYEGEDSYQRLETDADIIDKSIADTVFAITPLDLLDKINQQVKIGYKTSSRRVKRGQKLKQVYTTKKGNRHRTDKNFLRESRYISMKQYPFHNFIVIAPNHSVRFFTLENNFKGIWIVNTEIANSMKFFLTCCGKSLSRVKLGFEEQSFTEKVKQFFTTHPALLLLGRGLIESSLINRYPPHFSPFLFSYRFLVPIIHIIT